MVYELYFNQPDNQQSISLICLYITTTYDYVMSKIPHISNNITKRAHHSLGRLNHPSVVLFKKSIVIFLHGQNWHLESKVLTSMTGKNNDTESPG